MQEPATLRIFKENNVDRTTSHHQVSGLKNHNQSDRNSLHQSASSKQSGGSLDDKPTPSFQGMHGYMNELVKKNPAVAKSIDTYTPATTKPLRWRNRFASERAGYLSNQQASAEVLFNSKAPTTPASDRISRRGMAGKH